MAKIVNFFIVVYLSFPRSNLVEPLRCYECSALLGTDATSESLACLQSTECSRNHICAKFVLKRANIEILHRKCGPPGICAILNFELRRDPSVRLKECSVCDRDECNSANLTTSTLIFSLLMLVIGRNVG